jgi:hypothetical protein
MLKEALGEPTAPTFANNTGSALRILSESVSASGTLAAEYLCWRAITIQPPAVLRYHPHLWHAPSAERWPAIVAGITAPDDVIRAIHRTYLARDGRGKAPVDPNKMTLGPIAGGAIRLSPPAEQLLVGEGIETCLSAMQETQVPAWSAVSAVGMRQLVLPPIVRRVTVLVDGDQAGEAAARAAAGRWTAAGLRVELARAPDGKDFNDVLREWKQS